MYAYLRLAHCPSDSPALARVVNTPPRRLRAIERALKKRPVPAAELPTWAAKLGGPPARHRMEEFLLLLQDLHESTRESSPVQAFECAVLRTGYAEWLSAQKDSASRLRRIEDLRAVLAESPAPDLATWLTDMHLGHIDGPAPAGARSTVLSTIHSAKGAELAGRVCDRSRRRAPAAHAAGLSWRHPAAGGGRKTSGVCRLLSCAGASVSRVLPLASACDRWRHRPSRAPAAVAFHALTATRTFGARQHRSSRLRSL